MNKRAFYLLNTNFLQVHKKFYYHLEHSFNLTNSKNLQQTGLWSTFLVAHYSDSPFFNLQKMSNI